MPEALAVLGILVVAVAAWLGAWWQARDPANYNAQEEAERLRHQADWLEQRLRVAQRENWGAEMEAGIREELQGARQRLAAAKACPVVRG